MGGRGLHLNNVGFGLDRAPSVRGGMGKGITMECPKVFHAYYRGAYYRWYQDNAPRFGFSGRAAYALGMDKPNYPVPAILGPVIIWEDAIDFTYAGLDEWGCYEFNFSIEAETRE